MEHVEKKGKENLTYFLGLDIYTLRISRLSLTKKEEFGGLVFTRLLALKRGYPSYTDGATGIPVSSIRVGAILQ